MPVYRYEILNHNQQPVGACFEIEQSIHDEALSHHPITGQAVRRIIQNSYFNQRYGDQKDKNKIADHRLKQQGLTKYVRSDENTYQKVVNSDSKMPQTIHRPSTPTNNE